MTCSKCKRKQIYHDGLCVHCFRQKAKQYNRILLEQEMVDRMEHAQEEEVNRARVEVRRSLRSLREIGADIDVEYGKAVPDQKRIAELFAEKRLARIRL